MCVFYQQPDALVCGGGAQPMLLHGTYECVGHAQARTAGSLDHERLTHDGLRLMPADRQCAVYGSHGDGGGALDVVVEAAMRVAVALLWQNDVYERRQRSAQCRV